MRGLALILIGAGFLGGCASEPRVVNSSFGAQFEELNKQGWQVSRNDSPAQKAKRSTDPLNDPNVRVIRGANWSNLQFRTNFQVDDPNARQAATQPGQPGQQPANTPASPMMPWGAAPMTPGR